MTLFICIAKYYSNLKQRHRFPSQSKLLTQNEQGKTKN